MKILRNTIASLANILRNCTVQMDRSIEILQILRLGMESMLQGVESTSVRYTRIFNFDQRRVALRMEVSEDGQAFIPMGRIDVLEIPTNNGRVTCSCTLTELQTGNSQRIILRLKNTEERENECEKVFGFFRKVLALDEKEPSVETDAEENPPVPREGFPTSTRGSHKQTPRD